jgi:hypothetical protein
MSNEMKDRMLLLLTQVDDVKARETALQAEKSRHEAQITQSAADLQRTNDDLDKCRDDSLVLRKQMDDLKNEIFARPDEEVIIKDDAHVPVAGDDQSRESEGKRLWNERARQIKAAS